MNTVLYGFTEDTTIPGRGGDWVYRRVNIPPGTLPEFNTAEKTLYLTIKGVWSFLSSVEVN